MLFPKHVKVSSLALCLYSDNFLPLDTSLSITVSQNTTHSLKPWENRLLDKAFPEPLLSFVLPAWAWSSIKVWTSSTMDYLVCHTAEYLRSWGLKSEWLGFNPLRVFLVYIWPCVHFLIYLCFSSLMDKIKTITSSKKQKSPVFWSNFLPSYFSLYQFLEWIQVFWELVKKNLNRGNISFGLNGMQSLPCTVKFLLTILM